MAASRLVGAPGRIGNEHQSADLGMMPQEEFKHGELLAQDRRP